MAKPSLSKRLLPPATPPRVSSRARSPIEHLETRRLCSVTVSQSWIGYYTLQGTPAADVIDVAVNRTAGTFTVDGISYAGLQYLNVIGGDGNDSIRVSGSGAGSVGASISGGGGNDRIQLNFDGAVWGGDGDDFITLFDAFRGQVLGEGGGDFISVGGECIGAWIDGGPGDDGIDASWNNYGVFANGGAGDDAIIGSNYADELYAGEGNDYIYGEGGNDIIYVQDGGGADRVWGGDGYDTMYGNMSDLIIDASVEVVYRS
jgi:Ca2+-binding RTX toxin-like protein